MSELEYIGNNISEIIEKITAYKNNNYRELIKKEQLDELTEGARYLRMGLVKVSKIVKTNEIDSSNNS